MSQYTTAMTKGNEQYIVIYDDATRAEALRTLGRWATHTELSFSWYDAAICSQQIRATEKRTPVKRFECYGK